MKKLNNESLNVTSDQLSKDTGLKSYLKSPEGAKTDVNIVDKNKANNSASATNSMSPTTTTLEETDVPQAPKGFKYVSNLKDMEGNISQPFTINSKKYQMVRAMQPDRKIIQAVYSLDEVDEMGQNIIHSVEDFDRNIASPQRELDEGGIREEGPVRSEDPNFSQTPNHQEDYIDFLNLNDLKGYKDFFVNIDSGEVVAKFKNAREMIKSGIKLGDNEDYMDAKMLRRFRFGNSMKTDDISEDVDLGRLQTDVKKLSKLIKDKFMIALEKINTPIEQSQFLVAMANEIGVPFAKLTSIINSFKDISKDQKMTDTSDTNGVIKMTTDSSTSSYQQAAESRVMTKNQLLESIKPVSKK